MNELKPCPWCGCDDIVETDEEFERDYLYCNDCGAMRVKKYWNDRASPWVRVEDGLPPISEEVLVKYKCQNGGVTNRLAKRVNGFVFVESKKDYPLNAFGYVLAWMPIPKLMGEE